MTITMNHVRGPRWAATEEAMRAVAVDICARRRVNFTKEIIPQDRTHRVVRARAEIMAKLRENYSFPVIAKFLHRDHSSIIYGAQEFVRGRYGPG